MNKTIKLAVAGAVLSAASMANAGIIIPAGEWTMDINGNVNCFATFTRTMILQLQLLAAFGWTKMQLR